jgi:hypothetical protein
VIDHVYDFGLIQSKIIVISPAGSGQNQRSHWRQAMAAQIGLSYDQ